MKISYFIFVGFFTILVLFSIATYINIRLSEKVNENSEFFARSTSVVRNSNRFQRNILNMISGLRGYLFTGEQTFIQSYDSAAMENEVILKDLHAIVAENTTQQKALDEIRDLNDAWIHEFALPLMEAKKNSETSDSSLAAFKALYHKKLIEGTEKKINNKLQVKLRDFSNYEYDIRDQRKTALQKSIQQTRSISFFLTTISVVLGLLVAGFLAYRISTRIVSMVRMADEIAGGNYSVHIQDDRRDELGGLASSLNHMSAVLTENISLLERKNRELDQFAHIVSHDLKAPLRGIDNVATWIIEDHNEELSPQVREYIHLIQGRVLRAESLIRGILSYARIGKDQQEKEMVSVAQLINEIRESLPLSRSIRFSVQKNLPEFTTERLPLQMIFTNLLTNAVSYHDKQNGIIKVSCREETSHYIFAVEDNGPGIAEHYHKKIFVIFQTLADRDQPESTGVGLAIVKKILDERKQSIQVISSPGKGSTFAFTWPKY